MNARQPDLFAALRYPDGIPEDICQLFERFALDAARSGRKRFSADAILQRIRWFESIERCNTEFKCNDHFTAPLARWFLAKHPEYPKFFELRVSKHD